MDCANKAKSLATELLRLDSKIEEHIVDIDFNWSSEMYKTPQHALLQTDEYSGHHAIRHAQNKKYRGCAVGPATFLLPFVAH